MKRYVPILLTTVLNLTLIGCGGPLKYEVTSSAQAPGADARMVARVEKAQHSTTVDIDVTNLAPPERVASGAVAFVIWQRKDSTVTWSRVGALSYDEKTRSGSFSGTVPEVAFNLSICAENRLNVVTPSTDIVFSQRIEKEKK